MKRLFYFVIIIFFCALNGCNSTATPEPSLIFTTTPTRRNTSTLTKTAVITKTALPSEAPHTATPTPINTNFLATSLDNTVREFGSPTFDFNLSEIFIESPQGYYLDPSFDVSTIEMYYEWGGIGDPVLDFQRIERERNSYWLDNKVIANTLVISLIQAISNLHPEPQMLNSITHSDDYPVWAVELKSENDEYVLLYSNSNTPDFSPWNVIYNGQIYSQFDGQIGAALSKLFATEEGQPMMWTWNDDMEEGYLIVETIGWPGQMVDGFNGLIPIQSGFNYWADPEKGTFYGSLEERSTIGGMGQMVIGSITQLDNIKIFVSQNVTVTCSIGPLENDYPTEYKWEFECPVESENRNGTYYYPISVSFTTDKNKSYTINGNLFGNWEEEIYQPQIALPEEISAVLNSSDYIKDLLTDHQIETIEFFAKADPVSGQLTHLWNGEIVLLGKIDMGDRIQEYSVAIKVLIEDSKLLRWDLDRKKLQSFLQEVLRQPITQQFLDVDPNLVLNLYYQEGDKPILYDVELQDCASLPYSTNGLPNSSHPLYGFAFNQSWGFNGMQIVLINGEPRIIDLLIEPDLPEYSFWTSLLPVELVPKNAPMFSEIYFRSWDPTVAMIWDENSDRNTIRIYIEMANTWDGPKEINSWGIYFKSAMLGITDDGRLELINCEKTP